MELATSSFIKTAIQLKVQEIEKYMETSTGVKLFIKISKNHINRFTPKNDINLLYDTLVVFLHATSDVISNLNPENKNYQLLSAFHDDYIFPRYQAMREIISMKKSYFELYKEEIKED